MNLILHLISSLLGITATYVGVTEKDTWSKAKKCPTKIGYIVIVLATLTAVVQIFAQFLESEKEAKRQEIYKKVFNGWVSVGVYDTGNMNWERSYLQGLEDGPYEVKKNNIYLMKTNLNGRVEPTSCPDSDRTWFDSEPTVIFPKERRVSVLDVKVFEDCPFNGQVRVIAKVIDDILE